MPTHSFLRILPEVQQALDTGVPVVALESSVFAQGLPIPHNRDAAERMLGAVRRQGAVPAITAVANGVPTIGLDSDELERFLKRDGVRKVSARDVPAAVAQRADGATTVAASLMLASATKIAVFATGGIGGVHRDAPFDESADLVELARTPMLVVCAGAKSILDLPATWERLETLGVPVIGYQTDELPGFFTAETGIRLGATATTAEEIVSMFRTHRALGRPQSVLVVQPPPPAHALPRARVEAAVDEAQRDARQNGIRGAAVTPFLLAAVTRLTDGSSLTANVALLEQNAALAGCLATVYSSRE
jgi:pseudouridine-5'-phosphate glycosidase